MNRMNLSSVRRRAALAGLAAALSLGGLAAAAAPASAATASAAVIPDAAQGCTGDSCIRVNTPSGGSVLIQGWAYDTTFYGHFELTGPHGFLANSGTKIWTAGGNRASFNESAVVGQYCMIAWEYAGSKGYIDLGKACRSIL
jgi:hypothetical protein